jgi:hypothetical protein
MTPEVHAGTILIEDRPGMAHSVGIESEPAGWNFFFMAGEVKTNFFGALGAKNIRKALKRILARMSGQDFNCLEVTGITAKRLVGVPYTTVSAHWRHIQQSCCFDDIQQRRTEQKNAEWARG